MNVFILILTSAALSVDAFLTLVSGAKAYENFKLLNKVLIAGLFAALHALFAFFGYALSEITIFKTECFEMAECALFMILGIFALFETDEKAVETDLKTVILAAAATSFDAFLGGITLVPVSPKSYLIFICIFAVCFLFSIGGLMIGCRIKKINGRLMKILSAVIFFALAIKALIV